MSVLLDTNALVWFETAEPRLSPHAAQVITDAAVANSEFVCPISFWEIEFSVLRGRLSLAEPVGALRKRLLRTGFHELPFTGVDAILMAQLPNFHGDPMDRMITAVAITSGLTLLTADRKILAWSGTLNRIDTRR